MKKCVLAALLLALVPAAPATAASLRIVNNSMWDIYYIHVSRSSNENWGGDQLEDNVLNAGQTWRLTNIQCDTYDVKMIDEDDDACEVYDVKLCWDTQWEFTSDTWAECVTE